MSTVSIRKEDEYGGPPLTPEQQKQYEAALLISAKKLAEEIDKDILECMCRKGED